MASLRKLRRRLARWQGYVAHYRHVTTAASDPWPHYPPGYWRAKQAVDREEERRFWDETPEIWLGGPDGERALLADVRCCLAGDGGHDGPCVVRCDGCNGDSRCPECGGIDDLGCWYCEGAGCCPRGCDDGEIVLEEWTPARIPDVVTIVPAGGVL